MQAVTAYTLHHHMHMQCERLTSGIETADSQLILVCMHICSVRRKGPLSAPSTWNMRTILCRSRPHKRYRAPAADCHTPRIARLPLCTAAKTSCNSLVVNAPANENQHAHYRRHRHMQMMVRLQGVISRAECVCNPDVICMALREGKTMYKTTQKWCAVGDSRRQHPNATALWVHAHYSTKAHLSERQAILGGMSHR